ncbi:MAG: hypothetical protein IJY79_04255 [Clostridia bacterium]|nr:hypothetical protein [Clostridia bacterium]
MKINLNKSTKRALSLVLAFAVALGSLFTANVGFNVTVKAVTEIDTGAIEVWDGSTYTQPTATDESGNIIIETAEELAWVCVKAKDSNSYKVKDGIEAFVMQNYDDATATAFMNLSDADAVKSWFEGGSYTNANWIQGSTGEFSGKFDGNGSAVYGLYSSESAMFGLFPYVKAATIKNVAVMNSYHYYSGSDNDFVGLIFGRGNWSDTSAVTVENCVVAHNYIYSTGAVGIVSGHCAASILNVNNCLFYDNYKDLTVGWNKYYFPISGANNTTTDSNGNYVNTVTNTVVIGSPVRNAFESSYSNVYTDQTNYMTSGTYSNLYSGLSADTMKGVAAKATMSTLDWAVDGDTAHGKWYVNASGYPTPYYPGSDWTDIVVPDVWDGTAATEFAGGTGTKDDPFIIETSAQLRKMVLDGGRIDTGKTKTVDNNGTKVQVKVYEKAYYKVADGVTDIYLNPVVDGTLETIKTLASNGAARNWTSGLFADATFKDDADGDGIRDQATAFRGEFDGNGVTIHGLYSTTVDRSWNNEGVGFVPALMDDAVIKNVTFDKAYVCNTAYTYAGVITASLGYDNTSTTNTDIDPSTTGGQKIDGSTSAVTSVGIHNVTVKNSRVQTNSTSGYGGVAGFVASHGTPVALSFTNCLFDDSNELVVPDGLAATGGGTGIGGFVNLGQTSTQHFYFENCVSLGAYPDNQVNNHPVYTNCYTSEASSKSGLTGGITEYSVSTMPALNWTQWSVDENGELAVTGNSAADNHSLNWNEAIANTNESRWSLSYAASAMGNWTITGARDDGTYINYENMQGSGTKDDPYLISDALTLARVIGSGGVNYTEKLYFKLTNDINIGGWRWITTDGYSVTTDSVTTVKFAYVPFAGEIDGDGYAVTGLYANDDSYAALIPQMTATGVVKNLHIRNSYATGSNAAVITANAASGAVIEGCSVEGAIGVTTIADANATINNSYSGDTYYINDVTGTPTADGVTWYQGGAEGSAIRLVNRAEAMPCADIDGDGEGYEYGTADLSALKNKLLKKSSYAYVYGDVSKNGKINSSDLVVLTREIVENYNHIGDGFWRNVELGNIQIYYGENDNYDAARKLELYLEAAVPGVDIIKNVNGSNVYVHSNDGTAAPGSQLAIVVGNVGTYTTALTGNNYGVTYDAENAVLWIQGANFTGVEQAVLDFIAGSDAATSTVYTVASATLSPEKQPKTINGKTYYYAWGDEFDVATSDGSIVKDVWEYGEMGTEFLSGADTKYKNMVTANTDDLASLYEVTSDGKLKIWRGLDSTKYNATTHSWGYKPVTHTSDGTTDWGATVDSTDVYASAGAVDTQKSLLFKQGYIEMKASLPNDGHSFPAWWLLGAPDGGQNRTYETSLFGKVYKLNNNWTGVNAMNGAYPNSYKYQIPTCTLEFDIVELMQDLTYADEFGAGSWWEQVTGNNHAERTLLTGTYRTAINFTIHKWYDENVRNDTLYVIDWDANGNGGTVKSSYDLDTFDTTTVGAWTHRWDGLEYDMSSLSNLAGEHTYGFAWTATEPTSDSDVGTFDVAVYVDGNKVMSFDETQTYYRLNVGAGQSSEQIGEIALNAEGGTVLNQYVYFVLDNHFYAANQYYTGDRSSSTVKVTEFTDLLTQEDDESATFTIDYIRVYQEDGKRDIVTKDTENFNNGNHFGY